MNHTRYTLKYNVIDSFLNTNKVYFLDSVKYNIEAAKCRMYESIDKEMFGMPSTLKDNYAKEVKIISLENGFLLETEHGKFAFSTLKQVYNFLKKEYEDYHGV